MTKPIPSAAMLTILLCITGVTTQTSAPIPPIEKRIADLAAASACAKYVWGKQGRAPIGYIKGMAMTYARAYCESKDQVESAVSVMKQPANGDTRDALVQYGKDGPTEIDRLRSLFTLGIGLGMRESTGNTTEGPDTSASNPTSINATAGLFQTTYSSLKTSPWLARLYSQYRANTAACRLDLYKEGVVDRKRSVVGTGPGAEYQRFTKACPAFATEYAMVILRLDRKQFGPMNGKGVKYVQACNDLLRRVEAEVDCSLYTLKQAN